MDICNYGEFIHYKFKSTFQIPQNLKLKFAFRKFTINTNILIYAPENKNQYFCCIVKNAIKIGKTCFSNKM